MFIVWFDYRRCLFNRVMYQALIVPSKCIRFSFLFHFFMSFSNNSNFFLKLLHLKTWKNQLFIWNRLTFFLCLILDDFLHAIFLPAFFILKFHPHRIPKAYLDLAFLDCRRTSSTSLPFMLFRWQGKFSMHLGTNACGVRNARPSRWQCNVANSNDENWPGILIRAQSACKPLSTL